MRIRHIASMATGHDRETLLEALTLDPTDPVHGFLSIPPDAEPGTLFAYNQPPVLTLATILQRLAGERLVDYLRPRRPRSARNRRAAMGADARRASTSATPACSPTSTPSRRLGQLHLDDGVWNGRRILPEGWVADASSVQIANGWDDIDWQQGYGFLLWMSQHGYRGDGAFGQYMVVLPEHDAVIAVFSCIERMQVILDAMWEHLLPAMEAECVAAVTRPTTSSLRRMAHLALPTAVERAGGQDLADVTAMTFTRRPGARSHPTVTGVETVIETSGRRMIIREKDRSIELSLTHGWSVDDEASLAASATRLADGTVAVDVVFLATPHRLEIELDPAAGTFVARWPLVPLFGVGLDPHLASMRSPV